MSYYQALIKVCPSDPPNKREREIRDGLSYVMALLVDEYGLSHEKVLEILDELYSQVEYDADIRDSA